MLRVSSRARTAQAHAVANLVRNGSCVICSGARTDDMETSVDSEHVIASIPVPNDSVSVERDCLRVASITTIASGSGLARWFRLTTSDGKAVLDGTIARTGSTKKSADMLMTRLDLLTGDAVTVNDITIETSTG